MFNDLVIRVLILQEVVPRSEYLSATVYLAGVLTASPCFSKAGTYFPEAYVFAEELCEMSAEMSGTNQSSA